MATKGKPFITVLEEENEELKRRNQELQDALVGKCAQIESLKVEVHCERQAWSSIEQESRVLRKVINKLERISYSK